MRISEVSAQTGISIDTLRYYEKEGLICPTRQGTYRVYSAEDIETLEVIVALRRIEVPIAALRELLALDRAVTDLHVLTESDIEKVRATDAVLERIRVDIEERLAAMKMAQITLARMQNRISLLLKRGGIPNER